MSKKMEYMKKAVFYAKEKPETLAELLAGLVTDVLTDVVFTSAPVEVEIPKSDNTTVTYVAEAQSQYGDKMSNEVTYALVATHEGATITTAGVLTVASTTEAGNIEIKATSGAKSVTVKVALKKAE
jgi:hypothetical protein